MLNVSNVLSVKKELQKIRTGIDMSNFLNDNIINSDKVPFSATEYIIAKNVSARYSDDRINSAVKVWAENKLVEINRNIPGATMPEMHSENLNNIAKAFVEFEKNIFHNGNSTFFKLAEKGDKTLFKNMNDTPERFVVASFTETIGSNVTWSFGKYFAERNSAEKNLNDNEQISNYEKLIEKVNNEIDNFKNEIKGMTPDDLLKNADKLYFVKKADDYFNSGNAETLSENSISSLMQIKVIDTLYQNHADGADIENTINSVVDIMQEKSEIDIDIEI